MDCGHRTIQCGQRGARLASVRFIRFAKTTVLIANIWTLAYVALVFGWQTFIFLRDGSWQALPLSFVFDTKEIDSTGSIRQSQATNFVDALLQNADPDAFAFGCGIPLRVLLMALQHRKTTR
jgi:hypothetical protein